MKPRTNTGADLPSLRHIMSVAWRAEALCASLPKDVFFEYAGTKRYGDVERRKENLKLALNTCRECPVAADCYEFAVKNCEPHGIWSGTLPEERKKLYTEFVKTGIFTTRTQEIPEVV